MDIFGAARRLESQIARHLTGAAKRLARRDGPRDAIELTHAILDAVEREIQSGRRGQRVFPFNTVGVSLVASSAVAQARLEAIVNGDVPLGERIAERLRSAHCAVDDLEVNLQYVARPQKHWTDSQFAVTFSNTARPPLRAPAAPPPPRIELSVVAGSAERRSYAFAADRIDLGRGGDVRDSRSGLIRTNQVVFSDDGSDINGTISRRHAHLAYDARSRQVRVFDDGSVQGTKVVRKGRTVPVPAGSRGVRLRSGDDIVLGEARLRVRL